MNDINAEAVKKIIKMFRPHSGDFLGVKEKDVICGPDDRAAFGYSTNFPIQWLIEDYDFTEEEARWFVDKVHELNKEE